MSPPRKIHTVLYDVGLPLAFLPFIFHQIIAHTQNKEFKRDITLLPKIVGRTRGGRPFLTKRASRRERLWRGQARLPKARVFFFLRRSLDRKDN
jgi:hypothetical protein